MGSHSSLSTHTLELTTLALMIHPQLSELSRASLMLAHPTLTHPNLRLPSKTDQSPSPSRPTNWPSKDTPVVLSPVDAVPNSTTVSSLSDTEKRTERSTSSSRTPGVPPGEMLDTSRSEPRTFAVSSCKPHTQLSDQYLFMYDQMKP